MLPSGALIPDAVATAVRDLCEASSALSVVLVGYEGELVAASGDAGAIPENVRRELSGRGLQEAGSLMKLMERLAAVSTGPDGPALRVNVVGKTHLLAVAYDNEVDPGLRGHIDRAVATIMDALRASLQ